METADLLLYGLYGLTVVLGLALVGWLIQGRRQHAPSYEPIVEPEPAPRMFMGTSTEPVRVTRGLPPQTSMAEALAGIEVPVHWEPDPTDTVASTFTLTTTKDSAGEVATKLSDELVRLGYRVSPLGKTGARAERNNDRLTINVSADVDNQVVTSRITLTEAGRG